MLKLHQVVALAGTKKSRAQSELTKAHHMSQKVELLAGIARTYRPKDEDGERMPDERKNVQYTVKQAVEEATAALSRGTGIIVKLSPQFDDCVGATVVTKRNAMKDAGSIPVGLSRGKFRVPGVKETSSGLKNNARSWKNGAHKVNALSTHTATAGAGRIMPASALF